MKRARSIFIVFAFLTLSCNFVNNAFATPTPTEAETISNEDCPNAQPTQEDINLALEYSDNFFNSANWKTSYTVMEYRVSVVRTSEKLNAVAGFDEVIFCGVTNTKLDEYYSPETFDTAFQLFDEYEAQKSCRTGDLRLYEFKVKRQDFDYITRFWSEILDSNHMRESLLIFPTSDPEDLNAYSKNIMPKLPSCE